MQNSAGNSFRFDLWKEPWIRVETQDGEIACLSIKDVLLHAHEYRALCSNNPLVIVGIHRFLTAILQFIFAPSTEEELKNLWSLSQIPTTKIDDFAARFGDRFDLFSSEKPFFQSIEAPAVPEKGANIKSIANLAPDIPSGSENTHYRHGGEEDQIFCPACLAECLLCLPAFSSSGGAGIKPSINGVPPIYVIPCGKTLLQSLLWSLVLPGYQPEIRSTTEDLVWWERPSLVPRSTELKEVGYLHSLTFQPRRVRLYPEAVEGICTRCGNKVSTGVRKMIFDMGEFRPKDASPWFDPFAAYRISNSKPPIPIRPVEGKALWREYGSLFLNSKDNHGQNKGEDGTIRPRVLDQIAVLTEGELDHLPVRCIGLRTDMKAKNFEWVDTGFVVPTAVMRDDQTAYKITKGLDFSKFCAGTISSVFRKSFGGASKNSERYAQLRAEMMNAFWSGLSAPFRDFVLKMTSVDQMDKTYKEWVDAVVDTGIRVFSSAAASVGDNGEQLRKRYSGEKQCRIFLFAARNKELPND